MEKNILLSLENVSVSVFDKPIVKDLSLEIESGSIHALMGPNGSGKSTLAYAIAGHPSYIITQGAAFLNNTDVFQLPVHERVKQGLFLAFQHPCEIPGVSVASFLKEAYMAIKNVHIPVADFNNLLKQRCEQLGMSESFIHRGLNEGFSGGEKKLLEMLQLLVLQPQMVILDEIDSGLDVDALKTVAAGVALARAENPSLAIIVITHYQRILKYIVPDKVHVMMNGAIVSSGNFVLAEQVELCGYEVFKHESQQSISTI